MAVKEVDGSVEELDPVLKLPEGAIAIEAKQAADTSSSVVMIEMNGCALFTDGATIALLDPPLFDLCTRESIRAYEVQPCCGCGLAIEGHRSFNVLFFPNSDEA